MADSREQQRGEDGDDKEDDQDLHKSEPRALQGLPDMKSAHNLRICDFKPDSNAFNRVGGTKTKPGFRRGSGCLDETPALRYRRGTLFMKIAQIATLDTPVLREGSGSVEQMVGLLDRELTALGHEVTVFAAAGSKVLGRLVETLPGTYGENGAPEDWRVCEWINICRALERSGEFDIVHSHGYLLGLPVQSLCRTPMVHTLHVTPYEDQVRMWSLYANAPVIALSKFQWSAAPDLRPCAVIPHGIDVARFSYRGEPGDYVCFLGRFIPDKGALAAISVAKALGVRIKLAGPWSEYFEEKIKPLVDGSTVEYMGAVSGESRSALLGGARALLYPIEAPEPFGLVQVEAMMCGTPVVANRIGAVGEIVDEGVTGFSTSVAEELPALVRDALQLDRVKIRRQAEERFSARRMAADHLEVYTRMTAALRA